MQITHYTDFFAIHDEQWELPDPWIFIRKQRSRHHLPHPSAQAANNTRGPDDNNTAALPRNWQFVCS